MTDACSWIPYVQKNGDLFYVKVKVTSHETKSNAQNQDTYRHYFISDIEEPMPRDAPQDSSTTQCNDSDNIQNGNDSCSCETRLNYNKNNEQSIEVQCDNCSSRVLKMIGYNDTYENNTNDREQIEQSFSSHLYEHHIEKRNSSRSSLNPKPSYSCYKNNRNDNNHNVKRIICNHG